MHPLLSVIVPSFNQGRYIRETLDSIVSQDYRPIEVLVIDGASTDGTLNELEHFRNMKEVQIWSEPDQGVVDAVNKGLKRATGEILSIQSSDDLYLPGALRAAVDAFLTGPPADLVYGDVEYIDENSFLIGTENQRHFDLSNYLGRTMYIPQPAAFFQSRAAQRVGGWRPEFSYAADADFWIRIAFGGKVRKIDRIMARYRYHSAQRDVHRERISRDWEKMIMDHLEHGRIPAGSVRHARSGLWLAKHRYSAESARRQRCALAFRAVFARPSAIFDPGFPRRDLFPAYPLLLRNLSNLKGRMGLAPSAGVKAHSSVRQKAGAILLDVPRFLRSMRAGAQSSSSWVHYKNRDESLNSGADGRGVQCDWKWTSDLHLAKIFPSTGWYLLKQALRDWPIDLQESAPSMAVPPCVTFIIGHRGKERLGHLLATLKSIAAQADTTAECVVVEQSARPECRDYLPQWVRYHHDPVDVLSPYNRSRAFNIGARLALGKLLVLHDGDILVPRGYAAEVAQLASQGYEVINLKRFIFHLTHSHTRRLLAGEKPLLLEPPETVMQNALGGGSIAISLQAFLEIGGFDEEFAGWGGEDNEFWDRAQSRRVWPYAYLPMIHLWHPPQPGKQVDQKPTLELYLAKSETPVSERIADLRLKMGAIKIQGN